MVDERGAQARLHDAGMTGEIECRYYGRDFTAGEMALLRAPIAADPQPTRAALSREFCRRIGWFKPDGGLKDMMAKVTMLAMHRDSVIALPPPKGRQGRPKPIVFGPDTEPPLFPAPTTLAEVRPARPAHRRARHPRGQAVERVRRPLPLSRIQDPGRRPDALRRPRPQRLARRHARLQHRRVEAGAARQLHRMDPAEAREEPPSRGRTTPGSSSCPGSRSPTWARTSSPSSAAACPRTGTERYNTTPVLIETFVETPRYTGAVYRASGWIHVGTTQGRGRYDTHMKRAEPRKDIWLRPLRRDWKRTLNR